MAVTGCGKKELDRAAWIERGGSTLAPFKKKLMGALEEGLEEGPEEAIEVCQILAPQIAEELGCAAVELGRTSHKLRNTDNAPRDWVRPLLQAYADAPGKTEPEVVGLQGGGVGYVEPIRMQALCLTCHGSEVPTGVETRLMDLYPGDQARGFEDGEFRGLFWVEFK